MTLPVYRSSEPLYIVIVRSPNAETLLRDWARTNHVQVHIENNRMKLYEMNNLQTFQMNWPGSWDQISIWDCWNRRHVVL